MDEESGEVAVAVRQKRGRPKKGKAAAAIVFPVPVRKRGRPKKAKMSSIDEPTMRTLTPMPAVHGLFEEEEEDESTTTTPTPMRKSRESSFSPFTCFHCKKSLANAYGLQYHVENFVCRPLERPGGPVKKGRRPNQSKTAGPKKKKSKDDVTISESSDIVDDNEIGVYSFPRDNNGGKWSQGKKNLSAFR